MQKLKNWLENEEVGDGPGTGLRVGGVNAGQGQWEGRHGQEGENLHLSHAARVMGAQVQRGAPAARQHPAHGVGGQPPGQPAPHRRAARCLRTRPPYQPLPPPIF